MGLFAALSIVFGKLLAFNIGDMIRISFENLPILFAGIFLGPICGAVTGVAADLLGCLLVGYTINPIITLGAAAIGFSSGLLFRVTKPLPAVLRVSVATLTAHLLGSLLIKTAGLVAFYGGVGYPMLLLWRSYYLAIAITEGVIIYVLYKSYAARVLYRVLGIHAK
jgi:ECF transporter S component (folate family)